MSIFISEITFFIKLFDIFASNMEGCSVVFAFERILNFFSVQKIYILGDQRIFNVHLRLTEIFKQP